MYDSFLKYYRTNKDRDVNMLFNLHFMICKTEKDFKDVSKDYPSVDEVNCYIDLLVKRYLLREKLELLDANKFKKFIDNFNTKKEKDKINRKKQQDIKKVDDIQRLLKMKGDYYVK